MKLKKIATPESVADKIFNLAVEKLEVFKDQNGECYVVIENSVLYFSNTESIQNCLRNLYFNRYNKTVKNVEIKTAFETLLCCAENCKDVVPVAVRIYREGNTIYYDLCDKENHVVKCGINLHKIVALKGQQFFFKRENTMKSQVIPNMDADITKSFELLSSFFNIDKNQDLLFIAYIVAAFIPDISHPILIIEGEKGAGKTTMQRNISSIIHPISKDVFVLPVDINNLVTVLSNNYYCAFDNIGTISPDVCNVLCQAVTGGSLSKRKLYSDNTEISINLRRLVALNGISMHIKQSDLMDRSIMVRLNRIDSFKRSTEESLKKDFQTALPDILGAIFQIISKTLIRLDKVKLKKLPRMADFAKYGYCIAESIQKGLGDEFIKQYEQNQQFATESIVGDNPVLECVKHIQEQEGYWKGNMTQLLHKMNEILPELYISRRLPHNFPTGASVLSRRLSTYKHDLEMLGINVEIGRGTDRYVIIGNPQEANDTVDVDDAVDTDDINNNSNLEVLNND